MIIDCIAQHKQQHVLFQQQVAGFLAQFRVANMHGYDVRLGGHDRQAGSLQYILGVLCLALMRLGFLLPRWTGADQREPAA